MLNEDLAVFRQIMAKYKVDKKLDDAQVKQVEGRFVQMLNEAYELTKSSIDPTVSLGEKRKQQDTFNNKFKPI
jgi:hypothetical protein